MARPRDADPAATYERILGVAIGILRTEGVSAMTLRAVARGAKVSVGTLTYYFSDRESLMEACLEPSYRLLERSLQEAMGELQSAPAKDVRGVIELITRHLFRRAREHRETLRLRVSLTMELGALPPRRLHDELVPTLNRVQSALELALQGKVIDVRLKVHTLEIAVVRWALHTDEELVVITGAEGILDALARVESHLADSAGRAPTDLCVSREIGRGPRVARGP